jgi:hypothetical protein
MTNKSYGFGGGKKFLVSMEATKAASKAAEPVSIDHVICIDVSGSMSGELAEVRSHLKNKIVKMVAPGDTLSLIWFSGKGQHGTLLTEQSIQGLLDVQEVHDIIDRFLRPIGLTGFKEPLEDCKKVWEELRKKRPNALSSLLFMSDGCDNQWSHKDIFAALDQIYGKFQASTFVEYGYYADRKLLTAMAEKMGGSVVLAKDFPSFAPVVERSVSQAPNRAFQKLEAPGCTDFACAVNGAGEVQVFGVDKGQIVVPVDPDTKQPFFDLFWVSDSVVGQEDLPLTDDCATCFEAAYTALAAYGYRMRGDVVKPLLLDLRDRDLLTMFSTCFGKQRYTDFSVAAAKRAVTVRNVDTKIEDAPVLVSADEVSKYFRTDLPTIVDLLDLLLEHDAMVDLSDPMFHYQRISRKTVAAEGSLTFVPDPDAPCPLNGVVFNENRANISMRLQKRGTLHLDVEGKPDKLPSTLRAYQWRNFSLVADGVVHLDLLPVVLSSAQYDAMKETEMFRRFQLINVVRGISPAGGGDVKLVFALEAMGLTNEAMAAQPSGQALFNRELDLLRWRIDQKVYNHYRKLSHKEDVDPTLQYVFGVDEAKWLADKGFRAGLYQPKTVKADATDVYKGVEIQTSIKSFNSLPKIEEVLERQRTGKKLTPAMEVMAPTINLCEAQAQAMNVPEFEAYIERQAKHATIVTRRLICEVARHKFAVLMGQTWFSEATAPGELSMKVGYGDRDYECSVKLVDVDIEV